MVKHRKRAYNITKSEMSSIMFVFGMIPLALVLRDLLSYFSQLGSNPGLQVAFLINIFMLGVAVFFFLLAVAIPNYAISKNNLNILIDPISNPDYMGWIRFTRNKRVHFSTVKNGPLGQTKGVMNDEKADVLNDGGYTVITPCGNQAVLVSDLSLHNLNMDRAVGWNLVNKHFGWIGFKAYEKAVAKGKVLVNVDTKQQGDVDGKVQ